MTDFKPDDIRQFLRDHPEFFAEHPDTLLGLKLPHDSGDASSLLMYQNQVLRERNTALKKRLNELITVASENEQLLAQIHGLTLKALASAEGQELIASAVHQLQQDFDAEEVTLWLFGEWPHDMQHDVVRFSSVDAADLEPLKGFLERKQPACGRLSTQKRDLLFNDAASQVQSVALVPLDQDVSIGFLALGSSKTDQFHPGMETTFLRQLGEVLGQALVRARGAKKTA